MITTHKQSTFLQWWTYKKQATHLISTPFTLNIHFLHHTSHCMPMLLPQHFPNSSPHQLEGQGHLVRGSTNTPFMVNWIKILKIFILTTVFTIWPLIRKKACGTIFSSQLNPWSLHTMKQSTRNKVTFWPRNQNSFALLPKLRLSFG